MKRNRRRRIEDTSSAKSGQLLGLALFIMLLAFFIVLNSISSFEENKIDPIIGSLENTFSTAMSDVAQKRPSERPSITEEEFKGQGETSTYDRIRDLFRGRIANVEIKENTSRGIMMISVPYAEFSTAIIAIGQSAEEGFAEDQDLPFLPTLVSLLQTPENGQVYRMDMLLRTSAEPVDLKRLRPRQFKVARDKAGKLAQRLERAGVPAVQMSVGLRQGDENFLDLIFGPYEAFDIAESFGKNAEKGGGDER